jgi:hypothetical protein
MGTLKFPYSKLVVPVKELKHIFMQTEELAEMGVAVHPFGAIINPNDLTEEQLNTSVTVRDVDSGLNYNVPLGDLLNSESSSIDASAVGVIDSSLVGRCVAGTDE